MRERPGLVPPCPLCRRPSNQRASWLGRELLLGAAALGLVAGLGWASEGRLCEALDGQLADSRDAALERYLVERCDAGVCESITLVSSAGCQAKVRVLERRFDEYGDEIGLFRVDEGLEFSPLLERWRLRNELEVKQVLGSTKYCLGG